MNRITPHRLLLSFMLIMILLLMIFYGITYRTVQKTITESNKDSVNLVKMRLLQQLTDDMQNMETSQRGYIISGKDFMMQLFDSSMKMYPAKLAALKKVETHDKIWLQQLDTLTSNIERKVAYMSEQVRLYRSGKKEEVVRNTLEGKGFLMMEDIHNRVHLMEQKGREELRNSANEKKNMAEKSNLLFPLLGLAMLLMLTIFYLRLLYDIRQRLKAEEKLKGFNEELTAQVKEQTREIKDVFERMNDGIVALDKNWNITYLNKKGAEINGWDIHEIIGQNVWELRPQSVGKPFHQSCMKALETQQPTETDVHDYINNRWYYAKIFPSANGISIYFNEITDKKMAEDRIKAANERYELIAHATNDAIWDWNLEDNKIVGNPTFYELYNITAGSKEPNFDDFLDRVHPDDKQRVLIKFNSSIENKEILISDEFRFKTSNDEYRFIYDRAFIIYDDSGKPIRMLGAMMDISERKKAEEALSLSEEKYRTLVEQASDGIFIADRSGKFIMVNSSGIRLSGYTFEELHQKTIYDLADPEELKTNPFRFAEMEKEGGGHSERRMKKKDGSIIDVEINAKFISDERFLAFIRDITERKKAEETLRKSELRNRTLLNAIPDIMFLVSREGVFLDYKADATSQLFTTPDKFLGKSLSDVLPPDVAMKGIAGIAKAFETKELQTFEYEIDMGDSIHSYEARVEANTESNEAIIIIRDITERKRIEKNLIQSENKYRLLYNMSPMPKWVYDVHTLQILDVNEAAIRHYGYSKDEFLQLRITDIRPKTEVDKLTSFLNMRNKISNSSGIWKHLTKSGKEIMVEVFAHDILYNNREARMILAHDVTLELEQKNQLRESARQLRQLSAHLQHIREEERTTIAREIHDELGQQLTALKMDLAHLRKLSLTQDDKFVSKLDEAISNVDNTIKSVRKIATNLRPAVIDDLGLIAAMEWQAQDFEKRTFIKTDFIDNTEDLKISGPSAIAIFRIFQESLTNIARHAKAKHATASIEYHEGTLTLLVADDGIGFDQKDLTQKKSLGLLGIKERVLLLGGEYTIESVPDRGTTVKVTIPLSPGIKL